MRHWIARRGTEPRRVVGSESMADHYRQSGMRVEGPFVPAADLQGAVEALREIAKERHVNARGEIEARPSRGAGIARDALDRLGGR